jgi:outer membrane receptor protein involved in Fe transport
MVNGEYQRQIDPNQKEMRYATVQTGELGEQNVLLGLLGGVAIKSATSKVELKLIHLQSGVSRAGAFDIDNDGSAVGQSGYFASSHNLEYNQRSLTNLMLSGAVVPNESKWKFDWGLSSTLSISNDPDIRKTAFTYEVDTQFSAGAGGNPSRIWRYLTEQNYMGRADAERKYKWLARDGKLKFGLSQLFKTRDYEILSYDVQFWKTQKNWTDFNRNNVLSDENIFTNKQEPGIYFQSGNANPNPNAYQSSALTSSYYVSNEFSINSKFKTILGLRGEYFVQRHTGRDQQNTRVLDNDKVLESFDFFPSLNFIYSVNDDQNLRFTYGRTIARPSFKELSFAQIIDPITNRFFNG